MSVVNVLYGVFGLFGLFGVMAASTTFAARAAARVLGLPRFSWFDERPAHGVWWRRLGVHLAAMVGRSR